MSGMVLWASIVISAVLSVLFSLPVHASDSSVWRANQDFTTETSTVVRPSPNCTEVRAEVVQPSGGTQTETVCEQRGTNLTVGPYTDATNHKYYAIKIGFDQKYRKLADVSGYDTKIYLRPEDDALIVQFPGAQKSSQASLSIFRIDDGGIVPALSQGQGTIEYKFDFTKRTRLMELHKPDGSSYYSIHKGYALSDNREYLLMWMDDRSVVVTNTITGEMRLIAAELLSGVIDAAISDDGRYVALGTVGYLYDTDTCGETYDYAAHVRLEQRVRLSTACPMTYIYNTIYKIRNIQPMGANFYFTDDNTALAFDYPRYNPKNHVLIKTEAYDPPRLDYLALGDSYSSGEGDIGKKQDGSSYYLPGTDTVSDNCHQSSRAYPFLLRDAWGIGENHMKTVACSGAELLPDYFGNDDNYLGQNERLGGRGDLISLRGTALATFTPGQIKQVEFVKKYQPATITFTAGGNDVGFANILSYCASPEMVLNLPFTTKKFLPIPYTCGYADEGSELYKMLYDSIDTQASYTAMFLREVKRVSPSTKIIIVGYPSFIASSTNCGFNEGYLNEAEKQMINDAVVYMNGQLEKIASEEGVLFADIEDSLDGGRLCEGSEYVTSLSDLGIDKILNNQVAEAFHPNVIGHTRMANTIVGSGVYSQQMPVSKIPSSKLVNLTQLASVTDGDIILSTDSSLALDTATHVFADGSSITTAMFSNETNLGTFTADSSGALHTTLDVSGVNPGQHVLRLQGITPSGEPITLYQFVIVRATVTDADADGTPDDTDPCIFIDSWVDEKTGTDICVQATEQDPQPNIPVPPIVTLPTDETKFLPPDSRSEIDAPYRQQPQTRTEGKTHEGPAAVDPQTAQPLVSFETTAAGNQSSVVEGYESPADVLGESSEYPDAPTTAVAETEGSMFWLWAIIMGSIVIWGIIIYAKIHKNR